MDYEKVLGEHKFPTYEELKTGLIQLIDEGKISREDAARLLPELNESEDEKIRKALIEALTVSNTIGELKFRLPEPTREECIAWLEKQKEQKPVDYDHEMWKNCEANFEGGKKEVIDHPEKYGLRKEQKPVEWSEKDEMIRNAILGFLNPDKGGTKYSSNAELVEWSNWLKSLRPSWKPSEEQMNCLCAAVDAAIRKHNESVSGYKPARVLKSLYEQLKKL